MTDVLTTFVVHACLRNLFFWSNFHSLKEKRKNIFRKILIEPSSSQCLITDSYTVDNSGNWIYEFKNNCCLELKVNSLLFLVLRFVVQFFIVHECKMYYRPWVLTWPTRSRCYVRQFFLRQFILIYFDSFLIFFDWLG